MVAPSSAPSPRFRPVWNATARRHAGLWLFVLAPFLLLLWQPLRWCAILWFSADSQLAYQAFIPLGAAALAWTRRDAMDAISQDLARLFPDPDSPQRRGHLAPLILAASLFVAAYVAVMPPLAILAALLTLAALVYRLYGPFLLRPLAVPLLYLLLAIPLPNVLVRRAVGVLQNLAAIFVGQALSVAGTPALPQGSAVALRDTSVTLPIAPGQSGLLLTLASVAACLLWIGVRPTPRPRALLLLILSVTVPEAVNLAGLFLIGKIVAVRAEYLHTLVAIPSVVPLAVALAILWGVDRWLARRRKPRYAWTETEQGS